MKQVVIFYFLFKQLYLAELQPNFPVWQGFELFRVWDNISFWLHDALVSLKINVDMEYWAAFPTPTGL